MSFESCKIFKVDNRLTINFNENVSIELDQSVRAQCCALKFQKV